MGKLCGRCGEERDVGVVTLERVHKSGVDIDVVNVPVKGCGCGKGFELHHGVIVEDFIRNLEVPRGVIDFAEIKQAYEGISTMDIYEKHKKEME